MGAQRLLTSTVFRHWNPRRARPLHATSYLDALRGYAAAIVMICHRFEFRDRFCNTPFVMTIIEGGSMVSVFYVISGFVLTQGMLRHIHARRPEKLLDSVASAIFRRYLRLFAPCVAATFLYMLVVYCGLAVDPKRFDSLGAQFLDWVSATYRFVNPIASKKTKYDVVLWTIAVEFKGSMVVYAFVVATCKLQPRARLALGAAIAFLALLWIEPFVAMFLSGTFLAEVSLLRHPRRYGATAAAAASAELPKFAPAAAAIKTDAPTSDAKARDSSMTSLGSLLGPVSLLVVCFTLLGPPTCPEQAIWPWTWLLAMRPGYWSAGDQRLFWSYVASPLLVWTLDTWPELQAPLRWRISQYLGELSFGIYVVHMMVLWTLYEKLLFPWATTSLGGASWALTMIMLIDWAVVLALADAFISMDTKIIAWGRRAQTAMFTSWDE